MTDMTHSQSQKHTQRQRQRQQQRQQHHQRQQHQGWTVMAPSRNLSSLLLGLLLPALAAAGRSLGTEQCPSVTDCILMAAEAQVTKDALKTGHVSTAPDVTFCQESCLNARHAYYQFEPSTARCFCFSKCSRVTRGSSTVGSVKACRKVDYLRMRKEELQESQATARAAISNSNSLSHSLSNPLSLFQRGSRTPKRDEDEGIQIDQGESARRAELDNEAIQTSDMGLFLLGS